MSPSAAEFVHVLLTSRTKTEAAQKLGIARSSLYRRLTSEPVQRLLHDLADAIQTQILLRETDAYDRAIAALLDLAENAADPATRLEAIREILKHCKRREDWTISE